MVDKERLVELAERCVDEILNDMTDRKGLRHEWDNIDEGIQEEIRTTWIGFVRAALRSLSTPSMKDGQ
jgi:hypothetical protein